MVIHFFNLKKSPILSCLANVLNIFQNCLFFLKKISIPRREFNKIYVEINGILQKERKGEQKVTFCYQQLLRRNKEEDKTSEMSLIAKSVK